MGEFNYLDEDNHKEDSLNQEKNIDLAKNDYEDTITFTLFENKNKK